VGEKEHASEKDTYVIPEGCYCYDEKGICPYWDLKQNLPEQYNAESEVSE
jgi:hypothetical protein